MATLEARSHEGAPLLPPDPPPISFAEKAKGTFVQVVKASFSLPPLELELKVPSMKMGKPAIYFSKEEMEKSMVPFRFSLVAVCSYGRPPLFKIKEEIKHHLHLAKDFMISVLGRRHLLLRFLDEQDFLKVWLKDHFYIQGLLFRFMKWSPFISSEIENSIVPIWIELPDLPVNFFNPGLLRSVANAIGRLLRIDSTTLLCSRPSVARVCVELDLLKDHPREIWIGCGGNEGFWQTIRYTNLPNFCAFCLKKGHEETHCMRKKERQVKEKKQVDVELQPNLAWKAKTQAQVQGPLDIPSGDPILISSPLNDHETVVAPPSLVAGITIPAVKERNPAMPEARVAGHMEKGKSSNISSLDMSQATNQGDVAAMPFLADEASYQMAGDGSTAVENPADMVDVHAKVVDPSFQNSTLMDTPMSSTNQISSMDRSLVKETFTQTPANQEEFTAAIAQPNKADESRPLNINTHTRGGTKSSFTGTGKEGTAMEENPTSIAILSHKDSNVINERVAPMQDSAGFSLPYQISAGPATSEQACIPCGAHGLIQIPGNAHKEGSNKETSFDDAAINPMLNQEANSKGRSYNQGEGIEEWCSNGGDLTNLGNTKEVPIEEERENTATLEVREATPRLTTLHEDPINGSRKGKCVMVEEGVMEENQGNGYIGADNNGECINAMQRGNFESHVEAGHRRHKNGPNNGRDLLNDEVETCNIDMASIVDGQSESRPSDELMATSKDGRSTSKDGMKERPMMDVHNPSSSGSQQQSSKQPPKAIFLKKGFLSPMRTCGINRQDESVPTNFRRCHSVESDQLNGLDHSETRLTQAGLTHLGLAGSFSTSPMGSNTDDFDSAQILKDLQDKGSDLHKRLRAVMEASMAMNIDPPTDQQLIGKMSNSYIRYTDSDFGTEFEYDPNSDNDWDT